MLLRHAGQIHPVSSACAAAVLTALPQLLTVFKDYEMVVLGAVMIGTMIFMPKGLVPTLAAAFGGRRGEGPSAQPVDRPAGTPGAAAEPRG